MNNENFYKKLGEVPELANDLFGKIENKIDNRRKSGHRIYAIAASIILALGILVYNVKDNFVEVSSSLAVSEEVVEELQIIDDYLSGSNIDEEIELYAYSGIY